MELLRLLCCHPGFELAAATSRQEEGRTVEDLFPHLAGLPGSQLTISSPDPARLARECSLVFLAVPHGTAMEMADALLNKGVRVIDLSADFRLRSPEVYEQWYGLPHTKPHLLDRAVFGLIELYQDRIPRADLVANPGCYPTSVILGLAPALAEGLVHQNGIVADCKSGASGAGRKASLTTLFCEVHDNFKAYGLGRHRHTPEIEQELNLLTGREAPVSFNTHLLPIDRGILATLYTQLKEDVRVDRVHEAYTRRYGSTPWVRVLPPGKLPQVNHVRGTMYCDIGLVVDQRTKRLIVVSAIDNLCRGASGQALANANLMTGMDMAAGLMAPPLMP
jgi:N-acetyl-gamma-glutamyl-phosphate reductase